MNSTISWLDKSLATEICCGAGVLQELEMAAVDGLLAMPRIGLGVGGLLLGKRGNRRIEVFQALEIPCSHALGPSFVLTDEEMLAAGWQRSEDGSGPAYELVGCYWSKPNGHFAPTDYDHVLFQSLCPEPWQVALVILPSLGNVTIAALGLRRNGGKLVLGVPHELVREEKETEAFIPADPFPEQPAPGVPSEDKVPLPEVQSPEILSPRVAAHGVQTPVAQTKATPQIVDPVIPVTMPASGILFGITEPKGKKRWPTLLLALALLLAILATSAFFSRDSWLPRWRSAVRTYLPESGISK